MNAEQEYACQVKPREEKRIRVFNFNATSIMDSVGAKRSSSAWRRTGHSEFLIGLAPVDTRFRCVMIPAKVFYWTP